MAQENLKCSDEINANIEISQKLSKIVINNNISENNLQNHNKEKPPCQWIRLNVGGQVIILTDKIINIFCR